MAVTAWSFAYLLNSSTGLPIKWPRPAYPLRIMLGSNSGGTIDYNAAAQAAAQEWNAILGGTQFQVTIATGTATDRNRVNEMVFATSIFEDAFDTNTIAVTTTWRLGNQRTEGDILFNSNTGRNWGVYSGPTQPGLLDLRRVALHELGHALGLNHPDEAGQSFPAPLPIMNSRVTSNDTLTADDITGAQNLYGPPGIPANDNFANAIAITLTNNAATVTGYNTTATKQAGEPNHDGNIGGRSIWWRWTAPASGPVSMDTRGSYSDTTLGVYTGSSIGALTTVASNDDIDPGVVQASTLTFNAIAGTTYFFAIDGFNNNDGNGADTSGVTLNIAFTPTAAAVPVITTQPVSATVTAGGSVSFSVTATGAVSYQWFFNSNSIGGATNSILSLSNMQAANAGAYFVTVTNATGSVNSDTVTLTVNPAPAPPPPPPTSSRGGGGGAPSLWFWGALSLLGIARFLRRR